MSESYAELKNPEFLIFCTNEDGNPVSIHSDFFCDECLKKGDT